jgi:hypothetical protein
MTESLETFFQDPIEIWVKLSSPTPTEIADETTGRHILGRMHLISYVILMLVFDLSCTDNHSHFWKPSEQRIEKRERNNHPNLSE